MRRGLRFHRRRRRRSAAPTVLLVLVGVALLLFWVWLFGGSPADKRLKQLEETPLPSWVDSRLIPVGNARSGRRLEDFSAVVIHYVGNPGTTAINNRNYFAKEDTTVSSHFVVGLEGEVVQCLPLWERSAASNHRNRDTVSIEVCHPDASGEFTPLTYSSLIRLTAWLCELGGLDEEDVIRHYDVTGKECPLYYVRHEEAWQQLRTDVAARLD
ncbi:MAG: N-acetylmuramoyl-L-alanine amidase [Clostridia bacterium]|nr:N-acetylmuramoyl-L-alanine amidase [Clostridia bacterium]